MGVEGVPECESAQEVDPRVKDYPAGTLTRELHEMRCRLCIYTVYMHVSHTEYIEIHAILFICMFHILCYRHAYCVYCVY